MVIPTIIDFDVINLVDKIPIDTPLIRRSWGRRMRVTILLEKYIINLKVNDKKIIIPMDPREGNISVEAYED